MGGMRGRRTIGDVAVLGQVSESPSLGKMRQWEQWGSSIIPRQRRGQREPAFSRVCYGYEELCRRVEK